VLLAALATLGATGAVGADAIQEFLRRHWRQPLAPQGPPPARFSPLEASLQPESCGTCHPYGDEELKSRVEGIQDRHHALMTRAGQAATSMLDAIVAVRKPYDDRNREAAVAKARESLAKKADFAKLGPEEQEKKIAAATKGNLLAMWQEMVEKEPKLKELGELQRAAQWRLDFVAAENSTGFHAPQETARILGESIDLSRQAEVKAVAMAGGRTPEVVPSEPVPDNRPAVR